MKFNIRHKLIAFAFCIALLVCASISLYTMHSGKQHIFLSFEKDARATADLIARTIANELFFLDVASVRIRLESSRAHANIRYTIVTDAKGFVLTDGTNENRWGGELLADSFVREVLRAEGTVVKAEGDIFKIEASRFSCPMAAASDTCSPVFHSFKPTVLFARQLGPVLHHDPIYRHRHCPRLLFLSAV